MIQRTISTIILWLVVMALLGFGGVNGAFILLLIGATGAQYEFYGMLRKMGYKPRVTLGLILGVVLLSLAFFMPDASTGISAGLVLSVLVCSFVTIVSRENVQPINSLGSTLLAIVLIPFTLSFFAGIISLPAAPLQGLLLGVWVIATSKFTDVGALLVGTLIGKHRMTPVLSPKKTWEGAVGGIVISMLVAVLLAYFMFSSSELVFPVYLAALFAIPIAIATIYSDLLESGIKREAKVKDSGNMIPGIGGAFDLVDSLVLACPIAYFLFVNFLL